MLECMNGEMDDRIFTIKNLFAKFGEKSKFKIWQNFRNEKGLVESVKFDKTFSIIKFEIWSNCPNLIEGLAKFCNSSNKFWQNFSNCDEVLKNPLNSNQISWIFKKCWEIS